MQHSQSSWASKICETLYVDPDVSTRERRDKDQLDVNIEVTKCATDHTSRANGSDAFLGRQSSMTGIVFLKDAVRVWQAFFKVSMSVRQYCNGQKRKELTPNEGFKPETTGEEHPGSFSSTCRRKAQLLVLRSGARCSVGRVAVRSSIGPRLGDGMSRSHITLGARGRMIGEVGIECGHYLDCTLQLIYIG